MPGITTPGRYTPQAPPSRPYGGARPPARPTRGPVLGPGLTGTITDRERAVEDARRFNEQFDEDRRRFDLEQSQRQQSAIRNMGTPLGGIQSIAPPPSNNSQSQWDREDVVDRRNRERELEDEQRRRGWQQDDERRIMDYIDQARGRLNDPKPTTSGGGMSADESAARAASFARAKEQAGSTARASLDALYDVMASSGRAGSGAEAAAAGGVVGGAAGDINDFTREQYIQDLDRSRDIADRDYAGDLTRRGQDTSWLQSLLGILQSRGGGLY